MNQDRPLGRRAFLAGAGSVGLGTGGLSVGARAQDEYFGKLVFTYDDSPPEDYTKTFPVHREEGAPGCVAAVADRIGRDDGIAPDHLREMESAGWEVLSHTVKHRALGTLEVTEDVAVGDTKIYDVSNRHGAHPGDRVRIFDDEKHVIATVAGRGVDETGDYVVLEEPIDESFEALESFVRYTDERLRTSLRASKRKLEEYGFDVSSLVLPYDINGERITELAPEYYDAVANTRWDGDGLNLIQFLDPYGLHRRYFRAGRMTETDLEDYLDQVANLDVLGILGGHSHYEELTADRIRAAIRMARDRNIEILTLRDALADLGATDQTATPTMERTSTSPARSGAGATATTSGPTTQSTQDPAASSSGQSGFGVVAAVAGVSLLAWKHRGE